ncbi:MAG: hypothetical protein EPN14_09285 [Gallionella sp.]|nr:MAG: hypothetical protein EPN14_09285 [Gallionella sp.]
MAANWRYPFAGARRHNMLHWASRSTFYHIVIDRFATGKNCFQYSKGPHYPQELRHRMGGNLDGVIQSLDYLHGLGIGALLLTPFFKGSKYHGYWTTDFLKIDPCFGSPQQLEQLIDAAHQRDMRVVLDLPFTHCHIGADPARQALDNACSPFRGWFHYDRAGGFKGFYGDRNLPELNLEFPDVIEFLKNMLDHWLRFGFDGIRFDHAKRPSAAFWEQLTGFLRARHPQVFLLGENWHESGEIGTLSRYLHGELNIPLSLALRQFLAQPGQPATDAITHLIRSQQASRKNGYLLPTFLDNHDMERAGFISRKNRNALALGYLLQLSLPYPPIIYYGSERGQSQTENFPAGRYERDRYFREPMAWEAGEDMAAWVKKLIHIRNDNIELFTSEPRAIALLEGHVLTYRYSKGDSMIMVAINCGPRQKQIPCPAVQDAMLLAGYADVKEGRQNHFGLQPYSGAILKFNRA